MIINSEERFQQETGFETYIWISMGDKLWILPMSDGDFAYMEGGSWFNRSHGTELMTEPAHIQVRQPLISREWVKY